MERPETVSKYAKYVSPGKVDTYTKYDVMLVPQKRKGSFIYDVNGTRYINCHCNGGVFNLGHRNSAIIKAVTDAMKTYDIGNHHLVSEPRAYLAEKIARNMPPGLNQVVYGVGGGEAIDLAIKLARGVTGRSQVISAKGGYHGHTGFALATGDTRYREKFHPRLPGFKQVSFNDVDAIQKAVSEDTAAVIFETIPATLGIVVPDKDYFKKVRKICDDAGALMIQDEVQTGFGRTGKLWGFQHFKVKPDMVVIGKGMSGGIYPISATIYNEKMSYFFREDPFVHISTYGGSEIGCFAAMKVLDISSDREFLANVNTMGKYFRNEITGLASRYSKLGCRVRGMGLMMGLEFKDETTALFMMKLLFENGVYLVYSGNDPRILQFLPTLVINEKEAGMVLKAIDKSMKALNG